MENLNIFSTCIVTLLLTIVSVTDANHEIQKYLEEYNVSRIELIKKEDQLCLGGFMVINGTERTANEVFKRLKFIDIARKNIIGKHFYDAKDDVQKSLLYQLIRKMPKGANLHIHDLGSVSSDWFIANLTYMEGFHSCKDKNASDRLVFTFRKEKKPNYKKCKYAEVQRFKNENATYDKKLKTLIDLHSIRDPQKILPNDKMWKLFCDMYDRVEDAVYYLPAFKAFHRRMLEEMYEDKIMYAEVRTQFYELYDNTEKVYSRKDTVKTLVEIVEEFKRDHADFIGVKFIYAIVRHGSEGKLRNEIKQYQELREKFPDVIIGLAFVGWEDIGYPLHTFIKDFTELKTEHAQFFFQAGETNLLGDTSDYNLFDAFLLFTRRIGMGYALWKHPHVLKQVMSRDIPIEICPVSNQITSFVKDLRNHPGGYYIAKNATVVVGSDSPGFFGTTGLSTDFYYTIMSLTSSKSDLKTLKKLALNSINYSAMDETERERALEIFEEKWREFLKVIIEDYKKSGINERDWEYDVPNWRINDTYLNV